MISRRALSLAIACLVAIGACTTRRESARRVVLVGWDGASEAVLRPLLDRGELPSLARIIAGGAYGSLETISPTHSPIIWTSIATGKSAAKHGISGFWRKAPDTGREVLFSARDRRAKTLWQILSEKRLESDVVGWWVSWPADAIRGHVISDRFVFNRFQIIPKAGAVPERPAEGLAHPAALAEEMRSCVRSPDGVRADEIERFVRGPVSLASELHVHDPIDELRIAYAQDESHLCMAKRLLEKRRPTLAAVYVEGTDIVCHYFWKYRFPEEWAKHHEPVPPREIERFGGVIDEYFRHQDRRLGEVLALAGDDATVIVLSDHGFTTGTSKRAPTISGIHTGNSRPPGIVALSGEGIRHGARLEGAHVYDVTPTILALLGLPVARDMDGKVWTSVLASEGERATRIATIDSYEGGDSAATAEGPKTTGADDERIEQLKALGYVGSEESP